MQLTCYEKGKTNPLLAGPEGIRFDMTDGGGLLVIRYDNPTEQEIRNFNSTLKIEMTTVRNIIFMLFKFGTENWMDAPFNVHLAQNLTHLDDVPEGCGYLMEAIFCDTNGTVHGIRQISFTERFSKAFKKAVEDQLEEEFDPYGYNAAIALTYMRYPTAKALTKMSSCYMNLPR